MNFANAMQKSIDSCAKPYYKHKKRIERENRVPRDYTYYARPYVKPLNRWLFEVFPEAYKIASENGTFTPMVRQLYYVVRRLLQEKGCKKELTDAYHRKILKEYEIREGHRISDRKAVGDLIEPHSECSLCGATSGCSLGTKGVRMYKVPKHKFNKILYVEKTGFMQQLLSEDIHNKYDIAIAAGAGFSPQAAKELFAKVEKQIPVEIYCLHDADISGIEIYRTIGKKLVHEDYNVEPIDFGLKPQEAIDLNLPSEKVQITSEPSWELKQIITEKELDWLTEEDVRDRGMWKKNRKIIYIGNRVELNAFTPGEFIKWVEEKLKSLDTQKVIPNGDIIKNYAEEVFKKELTEKLKEELLLKIDFQDIIDEVLEKKKKPNVTKKFIEGKFVKNPAYNWRKTIEEHVESKVSEMELDEFVERF